MRKLATLALALVAALAIVPARAQAPAPASPNCTVAKTTGFYAGVNAIGVGSNLDIAGQGLAGSLFAAGGLAGANVGFQYCKGNYFGAVELSADYDLSGMTPGAGGRFLVLETIKAGGSLASLIGGSATPATPSPTINLPAALNAQLISPYVVLGAAQRSFGTGMVTGAGMDFALGGGWSLDLSYLYIKYDGAMASSVLGVSNENLVKIGLNYVF
jgi:opacity protein-like surface antigen